ncbi:hypothetical protein NE172_02155 [Clostridium botulinum]|uniref:Uncharacterized protein n=1 Tax=Clostridium botulinum TaxID=1491 RepID=A0A6B4JIH6_CLOBO|nr:hypothetical protein [Clostridium botulinum]EES49665.1 conserved hypothetical protein [Clostridium botulinum E1 str. 'BoNT E Beluga']MBY6759748.1 hypothetical protein [Clostridium botulinum]MBY6918657.1 hypothetical protein [Clostridium botulinum]MCR1129743.1 hypothetical protein [Clostridium botulinum]NFJ56465.1 hypothetical protein [Clostridium botulinum]
MELLKVKNGLLEAENYFLVSSFSDFAGSANIARDIKTGKVKLISNNKIERKFEYKEFVIELEKENFKTMADDDYSMIYLGNKDYTFGIKDIKIDVQNKYWKVLRKDGYVQAYSSKDGIVYTNIGGMEFSEPLTKQGFMKYNAQDFILDSYRVYANPYVTLQNAQEGFTVEFYNSKDELVLTRKFNAEMECKVFLDAKTQGYFIFRDRDGNEYYKSELLALSYGDIYILSPYNFEITYLGQIVTSTNPTLLKDLDEMITIKNIGDKAYMNISIGTQTSSNDSIQLSFDGVTYTDKLIIDSINQTESKNIFVKIIKNVENHNFNVRDFQLVINE